MSTQNPFQKASRSQVYLKDAITGPTGSGKTFSALRLAFGLVDGTGKRVAFLDTENDSASLYSDQFDFDVMSITPPFAPESFLAGILAAVAAEYGVVIIDSASHFWKGILAFKDQLDSHGKGNIYTNWKDADRKFDPVIEAVLQSKIHVIFCMRSKMDYVLETDSKGKQVPKKVGLAPIMRDNLEYEFSTVFDIGLDHTAQASKDRTGLFPTDRIFQITEDTGREIAAWLKTATPKSEPPPKLTPDEEREKRITGRTEAALKDKPESVTEDVWLRQYFVEAKNVCGIVGDDKNALADLSVKELAQLTTNHARIIAKCKELV